MTIESTEMLRTLYDAPAERAQKKLLSKLDKHCIHFIAKSPFAVISTIGKNNTMDASPRGGIAGFIRVIDANRIIIPDSKGNNRLDSLVNIIETGHIGMLFFVPGVDETLRLNGTASISTDETYLNMFTEEKNPPKVVIEVTVQEAFLHCAKALMRSNLWDPGSMVDPKTFPSMGQMLKDQLNAEGDAESREEMIRRYQPDL